MTHTSKKIKNKTTRKKTITIRNSTHLKGPTLPAELDLVISVIKKEMEISKGFTTVSYGIGPLKITLKGENKNSEGYHQKLQAEMYYRW